MRDRLNKNPKTVIAVIAVVLLLAGYAVYAQVRQLAGAQASRRALFTDDDGKTWYEEPAGTISPTMHDGKEAVRAHVYSCPGGEPFVAYMERFSPEAKAGMETAIAAAKSGGAPPDQSRMQRLAMGGLQVKAPGDKTWKPGMGYEAAKLRGTKCPDKSPAAELQ